MDREDKIRRAREAAKEERLYLPKFFSSEELREVIGEKNLAEGDEEYIRKAEEYLGVGTASYKGLHRPLFSKEEGPCYREDEEHPLNIYMMAVEEELGYHLPDPGIRPLIEELHSAGYPTETWSCEGGSKGRHGRPRSPILFLDPDFVTSSSDLEEIKGIVRSYTNIPFTLHKRRYDDGYLIIEEPTWILRFQRGPLGVGRGE